jgi:cytochrome c oxidase assembly protein subunit 11
MMSAPAPSQDQAVQSRRNSRRRVITALVTAGVYVGMACVVAFAAVPLYRLFCQVTGYGGTTQRADAPSERVLDRMIHVQFERRSSNMWRRI